MASSRRNKLAVAAALGAMFVLSACENADYTNHWDTSSARTGNAMMANTAIQTIKPWPPAAYRTTVGSGG